MSKCYLGIDLGGTFTKFGIMSFENDKMDIFGFHSCPTSIESPEAMIKSIVEAGKFVLSEEGLIASDFVGIGIGAPGPLNRKRGELLELPNIPGMRGLKIRDLVADGLGMPATLENDANAAALGEYLFGAGKDVHSMAMITLGTGVGGGIIIDGEIVHGAHDIAGELGHTIVYPDGRYCNCGQRGCLERYASATYLAKNAVEEIESGRESLLSAVLADKGSIDAADVNAARKAGDAVAEEVWLEACRSLAIACVNMERLLDLECIVIAGGLVKAGDDLLKPLDKFYSQYDWHLSGRQSKLAIAALGSKAGVWGAAGAAWQEFTVKPGKED